MIPNPIVKVLSTMRSHQVQCLLMGGQACVLYGAAEFSRDTDLAILAEPDNLHRLQSALNELRAECIAVPPFEAIYLKRGHGVHFRCHHPDADGMRIDLLSVMRNVAPFPDLWSRRTSITTKDGVAFDILALPDLIQAKKTQRDKDWPFIRRLVEADYFQKCNSPTDDQVVFWLTECRTASLLIELAKKYKTMAQTVARRRTLIGFALEGNEPRTSEGLQEEEDHEREADRIYWLPLRRELDQLRHASLR